MSATSTAAKPAPRFKPLTTFVILAIHAAALLAFLPYFFSWAGVILCLVLVWATASLGVSMTFHRLLSHKSWQPVPWLRHVLLFCASISLQSGPITWSATHRLHHRESDHEDDPHSPLVSFMWSHLLWNFYANEQVKNPEIQKRLVPDLVGDRMLQFYEKYFFALWCTLAAVCWGAGYLAGGGGVHGVQLGWSLVIWGSFVRTVWVWHVTWFVNSATHLWGYRNYSTSDDSRNLWWVAIVTFGEGWHNNHHAVAGSAKFTQKWWEFDSTWMVLSLFKRLGWVRKVTIAPQLGTVEATRQFTGKTGAQSPRLLRRADKNAIQLAQQLLHSPAALADALRSKQRHIREAAALALGRIGDGAKDAIEPLIRALADESFRVREAAVQTLARIGDAAVPALRQAAHGAEEALVRLGSQRALRLMGTTE
jgi:stearoyl-CoA desaturase (delta-9 desaturase)